MRIKPVGNQILGKIIPRTMTEGGILVPERAQNASNGDLYGRLRVLAVGPGLWGSDGKRQVPDVEVGQIALVPASVVARGVEVDNELYVIVDANNVHAVLTSGEAWS